MQQRNDEHWMALALAQAAEAEKQGEVPVGAVLVKNNHLIAAAHNKPISLSDASAHAEIEVIRQAGKRLSNYRLLDTTLYVTLEPCVMCAGAIIHARIKRLVYATADPKTGAASSFLSIFDTPGLNHRVDYQGGVMETKAKNMLQNFFKQRRK